MFTQKSLQTISSFDELLSISPIEFEYFSKYLLEHLQYSKVFVTTKAGDFKRDNGIDCVCFKENKKVYVQAKRLRKGSNGYLPTKIIRELGGCMLRDSVHSGVIITTLQISKGALDEAKKMNIAVIGKNEIISLLSTINPNFDNKHSQNVEHLKTGSHAHENLFIRILKLLYKLLHGNVAT